MRYGTLVSTILAAFIGVAPLPGHAELDRFFLENETLVSEPGLGLQGIIDPEFDSVSHSYAWIDRQGYLWLGSVDPATGLIEPTDGRGKLLDTRGATVQETGNGPAWISAQFGSQIIYTRVINNKPVIARAFYHRGQWVHGSLSQGIDRRSPLGSQDVGDVTPTIGYHGPNINGIKALYVRELTDPGTEQLIPTTDVFRTSDFRTVPGTNAIIFTRSMPKGEMSPRQIFMYDRDTRQLEQLTFDAGNKLAAFMWRAPEYNNEFIFFALIGQKKLGIYRYVAVDDQGTYQWERIQVIDPPSAGDYISLPEPFVYQGKSYITMVTSETSDQQSNGAPSEIWMTDVDPVDPLYRRLSNSDVVNRKDPQVYFSDDGPYIFISRADETGPVIMRLDSGLGPQTQ